SRRRHTRFSRDWSSDVCSSDLACFHAIHPVSAEAAAFIRQKSTYLTVKKGRFIRSALDKEEKLYFIVKGCVRCFIKDEGREITRSEERRVGKECRCGWAQWASQ